MNQVINKKQIQDFFAPDGQLATSFADYEYRPQQEKMASKIAEIFNQEQHLLVEAGTGTGKSFAYLVPSILLASQEDKPVVISTNTINLQEQLIDQDLPTLKRLLGQDCKVVLAKGRGNYLCLRRLTHYQRNNQLTADEYEELKRINEWALDTTSGCRSALEYKVSSDLWRNISSDSSLCLGHKCPYYESCFFITARNELAEADIIVANHHLLFADISLRKTGDFTDQKAVLPPYQRIICDEAHNLEEIATNYLGTRITSQEIITALELLYDAKETAGLLLQIRSESSDLKQELRRKIQKEIDNQLIPVINKLVEQVKGLRGQMIDFINRQSGRKLRLTEEVRHQEIWQKVLAVKLENIVLNLKTLQQGLDHLVDQIVDRLSQDNNLETIQAILESKIRLIADARSVITEMIDCAQEDNVYWLETSHRDYSFHSAPLNIAQQLEENLLEKVKSIVFTSATLTVNDSFDFIKDNLGLTETNVAELDLGSPFNYTQQLQVGVIKDLVTPQGDEFLNQAVAKIKEIINITQGRALILFNSYQRLDRIYNQLAGQLDQLTIDQLLYQGQKPRQQLVADFKTKDKVVLLGTNSFWEGVDIPGAQLSCVIIVKLPFLVPSDPFIAAKLELINQLGGNSFYEYMLPKAVIRFRQGCGRLIRRKSDQGWIFILDKRVIDKDYGRLFLNSLPTAKRVRGAKFSSLTARLKKSLS